MALPDLIEIVPLEKTVRAEIVVPGSKSITNRALILAALADGEVTLNGALWSEDTQIMVRCLQDLGVMVNVTADPAEPCNRNILVLGEGGLVPVGGSEAEPLDLFVGNAGTAARFLAAFLCLGSGVYRLHGVPRMHERPQAGLFAALRELGYRVEPENDDDRLPVRIFGGEPERAPESHTEFHARKSREPARKRCRVSIAQSSQFASALLLASDVGGWDVEIEDENAEESPYVVMTQKLMRSFPKHGGAFQIEPDASSGSYFWGANKAAEPLARMEPWPRFALDLEPTCFNSIEVAHWPETGWQIDERFPEFLLWGPLYHVRIHTKGPLWEKFAGVKSVDEWMKSGENQISRNTDLGDSIMLGIVLAPLNFWAIPMDSVKFTDLGRLRVQECERVKALRTELTKCGAKVVEAGDTLTVYAAKPGELHGAEIETYHDHRMAMCFAILGLKVAGIRINNPSCVKKTFPNFFQKLAAAPPHGLGAEIWEIRDGQRTRKLSGADLFAD